MSRSIWSRLVKVVLMATSWRSGFCVSCTLDTGYDGSGTWKCPFVAHFIPPVTRPGGRPPGGTICESRGARGLPVLPHGGHHLLERREAVPADEGVAVRQ